MEWKKIDGYENYSVSSEGEVRNDKTGRILKKYKDKYKYDHVNLYKNGKLKNFQIHRIVAEVFIPNPNNLPCIDHINTIRDDNRVENLRWCTHKENSNNPLTLEKYNNRQLSEETKEKISNSLKGKQPSEEAKRKMSENRTDKKLVICITTGEIYESVIEASRQTRINQSSICQCCKGKYKSSGKHPETGEKLVWRYLEEYLKGSEVK